MMTEQYTALKEVYDVIGMSSFSRRSLGRVLDYALANDWLGQKVVDLGCGTGTAAAWLAEDRFSVVGIDRNEDMLAVAQARSNAVTWVQADIRQLASVPEAQQADLITAFDVVNEMENLNRDIAGLLQGAHKGLEENGLFVFDVHTLAGLLNHAQRGTVLLHDADGITMFTQNTYDHELQMETRRHITFQQMPEAGWNRMDTERVLYGYRIQFLGGLLQRIGFRDITLLDEAFNAVNYNQLNYERVVFIAKK